MSGSPACSLAALILVSVLHLGLVNSQCTTEYCGHGEDATDVWTTVLSLQDSVERLQRHVAKQDDIIRALKEDINGPTCESTKVKLDANMTLPNFCAKSYQYALKGDFNGDSWEDILCHDSQNGRKWIYYGSSNGYSEIGWEKDMVWCCHHGSSLYLGDFDGDKRTDMLCHDTTGRVWITYADDAGTFTGTGWYKAIQFCTGTGFTLCIGDFNTDGKSDMLCNKRRAAWWIAFTNGNGNFENT